METAGSQRKAEGSAQSRAAEYFASIQDENGVDLTLIRENLRRTPLERLQRAEQARRQWLWIRSHARRIDHPA